MNLALLVKTRWEMSKENFGLLHSILSVKYLKVTSFWITTSKSLDSWLCKGILKTKDLLGKYICYQINNRLLINVWLELWIPKMENFIPKPIQLINQVHLLLKVSDMITENSVLGIFQKCKFFLTRKHHWNLKNFLSIE